MKNKYLTEINSILLRKKIHLKVIEHSKDSLQNSITQNFKGIINYNTTHKILLYKFSTLIS
jgi:hypothetical protein